MLLVPIVDIPEKPQSRRSARKPYNTPPVRKPILQIKRKLNTINTGDYEWTDDDFASTRFPEIGELEEIVGRREIKITKEYVNGGELKTKQTFITEMKEGKDLNETIEILRNWKYSKVRNQRKNSAMACHGKILSE
ncbi:hypothetical protein HHI36_013141 [Cryptolaemus montrouzieri]|uniref:Uncharacterized protein n=1 Tax=Cryptolaemus montrouzieri TaxID=559131 RepID=A0ABD2NGZ5_9CUCU